MKSYNHDSSSVAGNLNYRMDGSYFTNSFHVELSRNLNQNFYSLVDLATLEVPVN